MHTIPSFIITIDQNEIYHILENLPGNIQIYIYAICIHKHTYTNTSIHTQNNTPDSLAA